MASDGRERILGSWGSGRRCLGLSPLAEARGFPSKENRKQEDYRRVPSKRVPSGGTGRLRVCGFFLLMEPGEGWGRESLERGLGAASGVARTGLGLDGEGWGFRVARGGTARRGLEVPSKRGRRGVGAQGCVERDFKVPSSRP